LTVCVRGNDGALWFADDDGNVSPWSSLGGGLTSGISSVVQNGGVTTALARGVDKAIYARSRTGGGAWSDWVSLGGASRSDPVAISDNSGVWVFVRGTDDQCYANHAASPGAWTGWLAMGGSISSEPSAATNSGAGILVVARGGDNAVYANRFVFGGSAFFALNGVTTANPVVVADDNGYSVFIRGADGAIHYSRIPNSGAPQSFVSLGGGASSDPVAAVDASGTHVIVRGNDNAIWHRTPTTPWTSLGGGASADPVAVTDAAGGDTHVLVRGNDGIIYRTMLSGGGWRSLMGGGTPVRAGV
jgi:hypothetical protein